MNKDIIAGKWEQIKGKVESEWGELINDPKIEEKGDWTQVFGALREQYGWDKDEAKKEAKRFKEILKEEHIDTDIDLIDCRIL